MAKIYENQTDFQRDKLDEQVARLQVQAHKESNRGWLWFGLSFLPGLFTPKSATGAAVKLTAELVATTLMVFNTIRSWMTGSKVHDLELQRERLGPGKAVLLSGHPEQPEQAAAPAADCVPCKLKSFGEVHSPKSLADYALTQTDPALRNF